MIYQKVRPTGIKKLFKIKLWSVWFLYLYNFAVIFISLYQCIGLVQKQLQFKSECLFNLLRELLYFFIIISVSFQDQEKYKSIKDKLYIVWLKQWKIEMGNLLMRVERTIQTHSILTVHIIVMYIACQVEL